MLLIISLFQHIHKYTHKTSNITKKWNKHDIDIYIIFAHLSSLVASLANVMAQFCWMLLLMVWVLASRVLMIPDPTNEPLTPGTSLQCPIQSAMLATMMSSSVARRPHNSWSPARICLQDHIKLGFIFYSWKHGFNNLLPLMSNTMQFPTYRVIKKNLTLLWRIIFGTEYIKQKIDLLYLTKELISFHNHFIW